MVREQLKTILWLRWRLTRNQSRRGGAVGAAIAMLFTIGAVVLGAVAFVGGLFGAAFGLGDASPLVIAGVWLGVTAVFLACWLIGLIAELQRSETIDLQRLMHLPVALGPMFVVNYVASHAALTIVFTVPAMIGLALGLAYARGPSMLLLVPLALSMVLMITAWTYCLRGWLAALMTNPRRRRTIIMGITLVFILLSQGPNLYFNVILRGSHSESRSSETRSQREERRTQRLGSVNRLLAVQKYVPPLWLPVGAHALARGTAWPAMLGTLGCLALATLGLHRAFRGTLRFYQGATAAKVPPPKAITATSAPARAGSRFLERSLPGVPEPAAALGLATFRSMLRAPEVKMAWARSVIMTLIVGAMIFFRSAPKMSETAKPFVATGAIAFSLFMLIYFLANQFGFDRDGFRAFVLSPVDRRLILLGKNLASLPVGATSGLLLLGLVSVWLRLPPLAIVAAVFQLATMLLLAGLGGNLLSILVPYHIAHGSLKPTKMPGTAMLVMLVCQMLFPLALLPVFLPPLAELLWGLTGRTHLVPVNLILSVGLALLAAYAYRCALPPMGRLLQRREIRILNVVTQEVE